MRILIITQWFQPEPHFKGLDFAKALSARGHDVEVLTGFPNYPGGKVYPGYRIQLFKKEVLDGIPVTRGYLYPSHDQSALKRIANYVSFALSASLLAMFSKRPDVVYVYTPPMTAVLPAVILRLLRGVPYVPDVQDLWPDTLAATGMVSSPRLLRLVGAWTNFTLRRAARIIVLSEGFQRRIKERRINTPIEVVHNWAPPEITSIVLEEPKQKRGPEECFVVLFAGNMGRAQGLNVVIDAAALLKERGVAVRFDMVGGGIEVERLKARACVAAPGMLNFHPPRHPSQMGSAFAEADALLVHLRDDPLFEITIPSKTQAYLAVGKPILLGVRGDAARMVEEAQAGLTFDPDAPEALAEAIGALMRMSAKDRDRLGKAGADFYRKRLAFDIGVDGILRELEAAAATGARRSA